MVTYHSGRERKETEKKEVEKDEVVSIVDDK
jgi:hypothetical protein